MNTTPTPGFTAFTGDHGTVEHQPIRVIRAAGNATHGYTDRMWKVVDLAAPAGTRWTIASGLSPAEARAIETELAAMTLVHNPTTGTWSVRSNAYAPDDPAGLVGAPGRRMATSRAAALELAATAVLTGTAHPVGDDLEDVPA